jgi:hypothetical protein
MSLVVVISWVVLGVVWGLGVGGWGLGVGGWGLGTSVTRERVRTSNPR